MQRKVKSFSCPDPQEFLQRSLYWSDQFPFYSYFNPNGSKTRNDPFLHFLGTGKHIHHFNHDSIEGLKKLYEDKNWLLGYFSYDLKNEIEDLKICSNCRDDYLGVQPCPSRRSPVWRF